VEAEFAFRLAPAMRLPALAARMARPAGVRASASIISARASIPEARQNLSKLADMLASASIFNSLIGIAVDVISLFMALLSSRESTPKAYRLEASNAAPSISTMTGTSPSLGKHFV